MLAFKAGESLTVCSNVQSAFETNGCLAWHLVNDLDALLAKLPYLWEKYNARSTMVLALSTIKEE